MATTVMPMPTPDTEKDATTATVSDATANDTTPEDARTLPSREGNVSETTQIRDGMHTNATIENFDDMQLKLPLMRGIMAYGFEKPSVIQRTAIPAFIQNERDIIAQAQSGTGKTATFAISLLQCLDESAQNVQALSLIHI